MKKRLTKEERTIAYCKAWDDQLNFSVKTIIDGIITGGFKTVRGNLMMVLHGMREVEKRKPK